MLLDDVTRAFMFPADPQKNFQKKLCPNTSMCPEYCQISEEEPSQRGHIKFSSKDFLLGEDGDFAKNHDAQLLNLSKINLLVFVPILRMGPKS